MINTLAVTITAGVLSLSLVIGITAMAIASVPVPDQFYQLLPVGFGAAIAGAAATKSSS